MDTATTSLGFDYAGSALISERSWPSYSVLRRYVHGPGDDAPILWYEGAGLTDKRYLMTDERGSITSVTNSTGAVLGINAYDEYGIPKSTNIGRFGYTGQTWLPEIGMNYYKARMYSPTLGRFMQSDPIGYGDGMNWYAYVGGDPVNGRDPSGTLVTCTGSIISHPDGYDCGSVNFLSINGVDTGAAGMHLRAALSDSLPGVSPTLIRQVAGCILTAGCVQGYLPRTSGMGGFDGIIVTGSRNRAGSNGVDNSNWSNDLISAYQSSRATAIEMVQDADLSKEVSYSIFRDNRYKNLFTRFSFGRDGGTSFITHQNGASLILLGHVHNQLYGGETTTIFGFRFGPPFSRQGLSQLDINARNSYPNVLMVLHERRYGTSIWNDVQY